ncbi:RagB/SusD family nutrient uptake outer membrane protein [Bacteroides ovatus]|nr:RagB/SusD family nutrient uptake outer membrane protein [Bacteroides ovatus]
MIRGSDQFWIEMRYAEVLLNLAEALAEQDYAKNQDDALEALNEVRRRVDLPERTTQEAPDKDSFMKLLRKERICELGTLKDSVIGIYADGVWLAKLLMENRHMEQK